MVIKQFYCFPKKQSSMILYSNCSDFQLELFQVLFSLIGGRFSIAFRIRKNFIVDQMIKNFISIQYRIPSEDVRLVLVKKNSINYFHFRQDQPIKVTSQKDNKQSEENKFLGYPVIYQYSIVELNSESLLETLTNHWQEIKSGQRSLHYDFTHSNILNNKGTINIIDAKQGGKNSLIYDHFYFFAYLLKRFNQDQRINNQRLLKLIDALNNLYNKIFTGETVSSLNQLINDLRYVDPSGITLDEYTKYKKQFSDLLLL